MIDKNRYDTVCRQACFGLIQVINIDLKQIIFWDLLQMLQYSAPPHNSNLPVTSAQP
jgi:hypothetical protein